MLTTEQQWTVNRTSEESWVLALLAFQLPFGFSSWQGKPSSFEDVMNTLYTLPSHLVAGVCEVLRKEDQRFGMPVAR